MRFEHILQIYWTKGLFFGGKLFYTDKSWSEVFSNTPGLGPSIKLKLLRRFELQNNLQLINKDIAHIETQNKVNIISTLNIIFSQLNSVNNLAHDLKTLVIIRLYLTKSYKGKCHALGKPVNGQRTWSNAWNSFHVNRVLRKFISETRRQLSKDTKKEKINFKLTKKKYAPQKIKNKSVLTVKKMWF